MWRKPTVAIFSTGDELVSPGEERRLGCVYDSNGAVLAAAVEEAGGAPVRLGIARDVESEIAAVLDRALQYDMVLLSGERRKARAILPITPSASFRILASWFTESR